jgi:hypothetical protein
MAGERYIVPAVYENEMTNIMNVKLHCENDQKRKSNATVILPSAPWKDPYH